MEAATTEQQEQHEENDAAAERLVAEITQTFPPVLAGVMTGFEAAAIEFPAAVGGKALELRAMCGPLMVKLRVDPEFAELICTEIMRAAKGASTLVTPADMTQVEAVAKQAEALRVK